uniref:Uncharacterized protein n=1 Tax=Nelumbo nucifera TaxID=4432 RepID=A0A822ZQY8_NELNU|nr:TPA_asm: hypothetical protein HUJ06_003989 [Nelumbo nucifera]
MKVGSLKDNRNLEELNDEAGLFTVLPVSAESTRLSDRKGNGPSNGPSSFN